MTMTVVRLAERAGVAPHVVRYYTRRGLLSPGRDPGNGYRRYAEEDIARLRFIRLARRAGCGLDDIALILEGLDRRTLSEEWLRSRWQQRLDETRSKLMALNEVAGALVRVLAHCESDPPRASDVQALSRWMQRALQYTPRT